MIMSAVYVVSRCGVVTLPALTPNILTHSYHPYGAYFYTPAERCRISVA